MAENDWFQKEGEEAMTGFALGVHQSLIKKGINPKIDPQSYYGEIDKQMRATFPNYFNKQVVETEEAEAPLRLLVPWLPLLREVQKNHAKCN